MNTLSKTLDIRINRESTHQTNKISVQKPRHGLVRDATGACLAMLGTHIGSLVAISRKIVH